MDGTAVSLLTPERTRGIIDPKRLLLGIGIVISCALGLFLNVHLYWSSIEEGVDFNQVYAASRLAGTGHLYDWSALTALEAPNDPPSHCGRLPVVAYGVKLISWMPFPVALQVWRAASVAALLIVCAAWPGANRVGLLVAFLWSGSALFLVWLGQDVPYWLLFFGAGMALLQRGYPRLAGVVFALCICKYHLAIGIPIMLVSQKRWKSLIAGGLAVLALLAASFAIEGSSWPHEYLRTVSAPEFSPDVRNMPNLYGLASWARVGANVLELSAAAGVALLLWFACRRISSVGLAAAAAAGCGLIIGHHAYFYDLPLIIPLAVLTIQSNKSALWLRAWAVLMLSPIFPQLLLLTRPFVGQILLVGFVVLAVVGALLSNSPKHSEVPA